MQSLQNTLARQSSLQNHIPLHTNFVNNGTNMDQSNCSGVVFNNTQGSTFNNNRSSFLNLNSNFGQANNNNINTMNISNNANMLTPEQKLRQSLGLHRSGGGGIASMHTGDPCVVGSG